MTPKELRDVAHIMLNLDKDTLEDAGVLKRGQVGGSDWKRFNDQPLMFILKLPDDKLEKLTAVIAAELVH